MSKFTRRERLPPQRYSGEVLQQVADIDAGRP
jgi:hypothetical protein